MGKESCMIRVESKEQFDAIKEQAQFMVTMYGRESCPHCQEIKPLMEKRCGDVSDFVPVVYCSADQPWCVDEIKRYKSDGIPLIVGTQKGSWDKPAFMVKGARADEVNKNFDIIKGMVDKARNQQHPGNGDAPQPMPNPEQTGSINLVRNSSPIVDSLMSVAMRPSTRRFTPVPLCTPGYDCDTNEFEDRAVRYLIGNKLERKRS